MKDTANGWEPSGRRVALVVVHGIGNQAPGSASAKVAAALCDGAPKARELAPGLPAQTVDLAGNEVTVCEAYWADQSHPDNPPRVQSSLAVVPELLRSMLDVLRTAVRPNARPGGRGGWPESLYALAATWIVAVPLLQNEAGWPEGGLLDSIVGFVYFGFFLHAVWFVVRRRLRLGSGRGLKLLRAWATDLVSMVLRPFIVLIAGLWVAQLAALALGAFPLFYLGRLLTWPFRALGALLSRLRMSWVARWVHRLGWVIVVLPVHSYMMALRAFVTLFSITLLESGFKLKAKALVWGPSIGMALLGLVFLCELLIVPLVLTALALVGHPSTADYAFHGLAALLLLPAYLVLLKLLLPALDMLLDVSNYHLASKQERLEFFDGLDRVLTVLDRDGYEEVHLLAHSLGTVLAFDWLKLRTPTGPAVASLHTIGSPLSKFWFVDYEGDRRRDASGLTGRVKRSWTNYWALSDPVSGALEQFDGPSLPVTNRRLRWLGVALLSHNAYWTSNDVIASLRQALVGGDC